MKKRVILIGAVYYRNLGDAALCATAQGLLSDRFDVQLIDIYGRTEFPPMASVDAKNCRKDFESIVRRLRLRRVFLRLGIVPFDKNKKKMFQQVERQLVEEIEREKPTAIIFAGGALIKGVFINSIFRIVKLAQYYDVPVLFNACGIDAAMFPVEWRRIGSIFRSNNVRYISVRDGLELLRKQYPDLKIYDTFDPAICANRIFTSAAEKNGIGIGIMLSHYFDFDMQTAFWTRLIRKMNAEGVTWRLFTNGALADQSYATFLLQQNHESMDRLVRCPETPEDLYRYISGFEAIISMRLHSHILAYSSGTPSIAIAWDQKINDFFYKIGKQQNCLNFTASEDEIFDRLQKILDDPEYFNCQEACEEQVDIGLTSLIKAIPD